MMFGPDDLCESKKDIMKEISFVLIGVKKKLFNLCFY